MLSQSDFYEIGKSFLYVNNSNYLYSSNCIVNVDNQEFIHSKFNFKDPLWYEYEFLFCFKGDKCFIRLLIPFRFYHFRYLKNLANIMGDYFC
jgi:hypothetical protein